MKTYFVSKDYSPFTGLRYCNRSEHSGEDFYHQKLNAWFAEAYQGREVIMIVLDGGEDGYGPSFLDEAFGNLIYDFSLRVVKDYLKIDSSSDQDWGDRILTCTFPAWEQNRIKDIEPLKTEQHEPWFRLRNDSLEKKVWVCKSEV